MSGTDYTQTPNLGLFMPIYDMDDGNWGFHINENAQTLDSAISALQATTIGGPYLPLSGGTMGGALTLAADPALPLQASTKQYVDAKAAAYLPLAGGSTTGPVTINGTLDVDGANTTWRAVQWTTSGSLRWAFYVTGTPEGAGNAGSDFVLGAVANDGSTNLSSPIFITRSTGRIKLAALQGSTTYANDAAAATGGVAVGELYRNGSAVQIRIT